MIADPDIIDNPVLDFFLAYWNKARGAHAMPSRADISIREIRHHLGWVCLIDALPDFEDFRYRVVGSRVSDYFQGNGTGRTVMEAFADADARIRDGTLFLLRATCQSRRPLRISGPGGRTGGHSHPDYDSLYLPLSSDGETADMVLDAFTFNYEEFLDTRSVSALTRVL